DPLLKAQLPSHGLSRNQDIRKQDGRVYPSKSTGSMVTSAAISGVLHISRNEYLFLMAQYSFINRPACRIIHTGGRSVGCEKAARMSKLFCKWSVTPILLVFRFRFY